MESQSVEEAEKIVKKLFSGKENRLEERFPLTHTMSDTEGEGEEVKFCLKVLINKDKTKVVFVEADSHFTDILLSFLILPLGKIVTTLETQYKDKAAEIGCLTTLHRSIATMDVKHFTHISYLLDPSHSYEAECQKLKLKVDSNQPPMKYTLREKRKAKTAKAPEAPTDDGVFAMKTSSTFIISDDLRITPVVPESILQTLLSVGITETNGAQLMTVTFGFNEIKDLLRGSLLSEAPLTDIILHKSRTTRNCVTADLLHHMKKKLASSSPRKMSLKTIVQKSTNKFLTAQAGKDFIEFLCSLLVIPLGAVEHLLGGKTCLKNIDNMYRSLAYINGDKYFKSRDTKTMLLKPQINRDYYLCQNGILPLVEEGLVISPPSCKFNSPAATYSVTDDLTVTPFCFTSTVSVLSGLNIPLSDVKEIDLQIGVEEAMNILKASLTSTSALTDGLINPLLKKHPKQER